MILRAVHNVILGVKAEDASLLDLGAGGAVHRSRPFSWEAIAKEKSNAVYSSNAVQVASARVRSVARTASAARFSTESRGSSSPLTAIRQLISKFVGAPASMSRSCLASIKAFTTIISGQCSSPGTRISEMRSIFGFETATGRFLSFGDCAAALGIQRAARLVGRIVGDSLGHSIFSPGPIRRQYVVSFGGGV